MHYNAWMNTANTPSLPVGTACVELELAPEQLILRTSAGAGPVTQHLLPLGLNQLCQLFGQRQPTALQLENAIAEVEDAIMPAGRLLPAGMQVLQLRSALLPTLLHAATGHADASSASREAVEALFSALAARAEGGASVALLPPTAEAAAALLIVRECMHHWGLLTLSGPG